MPAYEEAAKLTIKICSQQFSIEIAKLKGSNYLSANHAHKIREKRPPAAAAALVIAGSSVFST